MANTVDMGIYEFFMDDNGMYVVNEQLSGKSFSGTLEDALIWIKNDQESI